MHPLAPAAWHIHAHTHVAGTQLTAFCTRTGTRLSRWMSLIEIEQEIHSLLAY